MSPIQPSIRAGIGKKMAFRDPAIYAARRGGMISILVIRLRVSFLRRIEAIWITLTAANMTRKTSMTLISLSLYYLFFSAKRVNIKKNLNIRGKKWQKRIW
jgi:hypothetical protein